MTRFTFRLEAVRRLYETQRDERRERLAEAMHAERLLHDRQAALRSEIEQLEQATRERTRGGLLDVDWLLQNKRYEQTVRLQLHELAGHEATISAEIEKRRTDLMEADRRLKLMQKLKEKHREKHDYAVQQAEIRLLDEIGSVLHQRPDA